jgi:hypothetical protein
VGLQKSKKLNLDVKNIFAGSHIEHSWRCSYPQVPTRQVLGRGWVSLQIIQVLISSLTPGKLQVYVPGFFPLLALHFTGPHQNKAMIQDPKSTFSQLVEHFGKQKELFNPITPRIKIATEF